MFKIPIPINKLIQLLKAFQTNFHLFLGIGITGFQLLTILSPTSFLSLDHDLMRKLMRTLIVVITMSSMVYEMILAGRNCYPQAATMFAKREIRLQPRNGTIWFPFSLNSYGSLDLITFLQILFVIMSLAIIIATVISNKKKIYRKTRKLLRIRTNFVVPKSETIVRNNVDSATMYEKHTLHRGNSDEKQEDKKNSCIQVIISPRVSIGSPYQETCSLSSLTAIEVITEVNLNKPIPPNSISLNNLSKMKTYKSTSDQNTIPSRLLSEQFLKSRHSLQMSAKSLHLEQILSETNLISSYNVSVNVGDTKLKNMMYKIASSTSAIMIYNFILLRFFFELKDSPLAALVGYSYFKAVFDTIPLFVILTKDPIFDFVKRRIQSFKIKYSNN